MPSRNHLKREEYKIYAWWMTEIAANFYLIMSQKSTSENIKKLTCSDQPAKTTSAVCLNKLCSYTCTQSGIQVKPIYILQLLQCAFCTAPVVFAYACAYTIYYRPLYHLNFLIVSWRSSQMTKGSNWKARFNFYENAGNNFVWYPSYSTSEHEVITLKFLVKMLCMLEYNV